MSRLSTLFRMALVVALTAMVFTAGGLLIGPELANLRGLSTAEARPVELRALSERSYIYASDGRLLGTLRADENRAPVELAVVPQHLVDAILAVEDANFYEHDGIDFKATMRALMSNVESGEVEQGGSTLTQQLVKQSLVGSKQDFDRKLREAVLAQRLEKQMTKDEILERYLNTVYFGNGAYGVQAAGEIYFGVDVEDIDVPQAALLAGLIRDPIDYNPFADAVVARERRRIALDRLVAVGKLTEAEAERHKLAPLPTGPNDFAPPPDSYFVERVKQILLDDPRLGTTPSERYDAVFRGGLRIHTTIDLKAQFLAEVGRNEVQGPFALEGQPALFVAGKNRDGSDAVGTSAVASVEPGTGAVRAIVGGPGFGPDSKFDLATQGYRQPGSAFKTFVLLALLEQGRSPLDVVSGVGPCRFRLPGVKEPYEVENFGRSRGSVAPILNQTLSSSNCAYVRLGQIAGIPEVVELAGRLGIRTRNARNEIVPLDPSIFSTPLGTQEVTPLDMAAAYAAIASEGVYHAPYYVERVLDREGNVIIEHTPRPRRVFSEETAAIAADVLRRNVLGGTGRAAQVDDHDIGGKTGTAQDFSNAWFVGFSRHLSTAVWMGAIEGNVSMRRVGGRSVTGGSWPAAIFGRYMGGFHDELEPLPFPEVPRRRSTGQLKLDKEVDPSGQPTTTTSTTAPRPRPSTTTIPAGTSTTPPPTTAPPSTPPSSAAPPPPGEDIGD